MKTISLVPIAVAAAAFCLLNVIAMTTALPLGDAGTVSRPSVGDAVRRTEPAENVHGVDGTEGVRRPRRSTSTSCLPPDNVTELFQRLNQHVNTSTLLQPANLAHPEVLMSGELNVQDVGASLAYGDTSCPSDVETSPGSPLFVRSTCPWFIRVQELPALTYFPSILPQAECRCKKCLRTTSDGLGCERIMTSIRVLRYTGCRDGFKTYVAETRPLSVGCTCAAPEMAVVDPTVTTPAFDDYAE